MNRSVLVMAFAFVLALAATGCKPGVNKKQKNDLTQIGLAYHNYCDTYNKGPSKAEDLAPYLENDQRLLGLLKSGDIVFRYEVSVMELAQQDGSALTIVAYFKEVPEKGGLVLMGDGAVRQMTAAEFKATPLAKKKQK